MKVSEAVQKMTKSYLHRIIDSFTKDFPRLDEEKSRDIILRNVEELTDKNRIIDVFKLDGLLSDRILISYVLESLVNKQDYSATENEIYDEVVALERHILKLASDPDSLKYENQQNLEILKAVLDVALEDERISQEEMNLVNRLRKKLNISERNIRILLADLSHFPQSDNKLHTISDIKETLKNLQKKGVVFYCNLLDGGKFVVPDEIVESVKEALNIELSRKGLEKLLEVLSKNQLALILESKNLPKSGTKNELQDRLIQAGLIPSQALDKLSNNDLYDICASLPGAKVSGTKIDRINRIIDYFSNLVIRDIRDEATPGEIYYEYLVELANRDRENLLANDIIKKDIDMDRAFEEGTRYLFTEKLGLELREMNGSDNPDGCLFLNHRNELFMWDNKSKESTYTFPNSHLRQFKRYIRDADERVSCFMVIVPSIKDNVEFVAEKLKVESRRDTDVAIITAEDLMWVAENWKNKSGGEIFDLNIFNMTGILTRQKLEQRIRLFM